MTMNTFKKDSKSSLLKHILLLFKIIILILFLFACGDEYVLQKLFITNPEVFISIDKSFIKTGRSVNLSVDVKGYNIGDYVYTYDILEGGGTITGTGANVVYNAGNINTNVRIMVTVGNYINETNSTIFEISVRDYQKISDTAGNFTGTLDNADIFGSSVANIGDLDNDGVTDIAVGARHDDDGGDTRGAVWILFLNTDGTVKTHQKISDTSGNFSGTLADIDWFGTSVANIGDLDNDGVTDIAVGAHRDNDGGSDRGAVWILFMNTDGTVKAHQKISDTQGNFMGILDDEDNFGRSVVMIGDLDKDGINDIAVGANWDDDGGDAKGAIWILFMNTDGTVKTNQKISDTAGNFSGILADGDAFGLSIAMIGDLDKDGVNDIAVGAYLDNDGGNDRGAVYILFMNTDGTVKTNQKISDTAGNFTGILTDLDNFGNSITMIGDLNGDGVNDIAVGAFLDDDGGSDRGAIWILFLNTDGTIKTHQKISSTQGNFTGTLDDVDFFGISVASIGDLNNDGINDLAVGAHNDDDGGNDRGAIWILFLNADGTVGN